MHKDLLQKGEWVTSFKDAYFHRIYFRPTLSPAYRDFSSSVSRIRFGSKHGKSELEPKQIFDFVDYQYDLREGKVRPALEH